MQSLNFFPQFQNVNGATCPVVFPANHQTTPLGWVAMSSEIRRSQFKLDDAFLEASAAARKATLGLAVWELLPHTQNLEAKFIGNDGEHGNNFLLVRRFVCKRSETEHSPVLMGAVLKRLGFLQRCQSSKFILKHLG